jgi:hypothetical protein
MGGRGDFGSGPPMHGLASEPAVISRSVGGRYSSLTGSGPSPTSMNTRPPSTTTG